MARWGLTLPLPATLASRSRGPGQARRGGRIHRPLDRRDQRSRRVHAARAERRLDRERAARDRRRRGLPAGARAARPGGGGAGRRLRRPLRPRDRLLLGPDRRRLERDPVREAAEPGPRDGRVPRAALDGERGRAGSSSKSKPADRVPIVLAALRGKMLELAVERADGAFTNFLPLGGLPQVRSRSPARRRASSSSAASSACPASARRSSRSPASCSPPTSRSPSTRTSSAGSATASKIDPMVAAWEAGDRKAAAEAPGR